MNTIFAGLFILLFVAGQRISELVLDKRNTAALRANGGIEHGSRHYPLFLLLHILWLLSMLGWLLIEQESILWQWIIVYIILQAGRFWVIKTLGPYWTTRIISIPGKPLVREGPFRIVRHPNYCIVVLEIAVLPLAFGAWQIAAVFSVLNALLLTLRIKVENAALAKRS